MPMICIGPTGAKELLGHLYPGDQFDYEMRASMQLSARLAYDTYADKTCDKYMWIAGGRPYDITPLLHAITFGKHSYVEWEHIGQIYDSDDRADLEAVEDCEDPFDNALDPEQEHEPDPFADLNFDIDTEINVEPGDLVDVEDLDPSDTVFNVKYIGTVAFGSEHLVNDEHVHISWHICKLDSNNKPVLPSITLESLGRSYAYFPQNPESDKVLIFAHLYEYADK